MYLGFQLTVHSNLYIFKTKSTIINGVDYHTGEKRTSESPNKKDARGPGSDFCTRCKGIITYGKLH